MRNTLSIEWHQNFPWYYTATQQFPSHREREQTLKPPGKGLSEKRVSRWRTAYLIPHTFKRSRLDLNLSTRTATVR